MSSIKIDPKIIFWIGLGVVISMLSPDTLVKMMAVLWVLFVGWWGFVRVVFGWAKRKGSVKVDFGCEHRAHSVHCATMGPGDGACNCMPSHPVNCGHCNKI